MEVNHSGASEQTGSTEIKQASFYRSRADEFPSSVGRKQTSSPKFVSFDNRRIHLVPQLSRLDKETRKGMLRAAQVFPVKVNNYVLENLIDWNNGPDDPMYRLLFPHPDMLSEEATHELARLNSEETSDDVRAAQLRRIRDRMNPHTSDQVSNVPTLHGTPVDGLQHKYSETVLYFPKQGQTCHAYCSFCFRWPQFIETSTPKFESSDLEQLRQYLARNRDVTDVLLTGGDPMVLNARRLGLLFDLILEKGLEHVRTLRIGTKALSYWPYRFLTEPDSSELIEKIKKLSDHGVQVAIMAHINHWREMSTDVFEEAVSVLRAAGAIIRSQAPVLRHVNADAATWTKLWSRQTDLGIQPYYMFVERDTGAYHYFAVPLVEVHDIYSNAIKRLSGISRTARGPVMSASAGKIQLLGTTKIGSEKALALTMLQGRNPDWVHRPFLAKYSETATWISELEPFDKSQPFPFH